MLTTLQPTTKCGLPPKYPKPQKWHHMIGYIGYRIKENIFKKEVGVWRKVAGRRMQRIGRKERGRHGWMRQKQESEKCRSRKKRKSDNVK